MNAAGNGSQAPDPRHLIGGYASGTLTPGERKMLFEAALADPALFEDLMKEQALKEMLEQPAVRRELAEALAARPSWWRRLSGWMRSPVGWSAAGAVAAGVLVVVFVNRTPPVPERAAPVAVELALKRETPPVEEKAAPPIAAPSKPKLEALRKQPKVFAVERRAAEMDMAAVTLPAAPAVDGGPAAAPPSPMREAAAPADALADLRAAPGALEYGILRGDESGVFRPLASAAELGDSDRFKITVTPHIDGVVTLLRRNLDQRMVVVARTRAYSGATLILPAEDSIRVNEVESMILQIGDGAEAAGRRVLGFSPSGAMATRQSAARAKESEASAARPTVIEIPIRRRR